MKFTVEHWGIMAEDPGTLAEWYQNVLGFEELFIPEGKTSPVFVKDEKGLVIEFFSKTPGISYPEDSVRKIQHLSLSVGNFDEAVDFLESKGVQFKEKPISLFGDARALFFQDPEGNWIHLIYRPEMPW